jgi:hypothetical protein
MAHSTDIVAYQYKGDLWAPEYIVGQLTANPGDGHHGTRPSESPVEPHLDLLARIKGIDRYDESSFDSDEFPKVVFRDQIAEDEPLRGRDF